MTWLDAIGMLVMLLGVAGGLMLMVLAVVKLTGRLAGGALRKMDGHVPASVPRDGAVLLKDLARFAKAESDWPTSAVRLLNEIARSDFFTEKQRLEVAHLLGDALWDEAAWEAAEPENPPPFVAPAAVLLDKIEPRPVAYVELFGGQTLAEAVADGRSLTLYFGRPPELTAPGISGRIVDLHTAMDEAERHRQMLERRVKRGLAALRAVAALAGEGAPVEAIHAAPEVPR